MNNYDDLQFTRNVIQRAGFSPSVRNQLNQLIDRIQQRQDDPNLYLAVIGEFSSGKSTFINALLHDNLLKSGTLVTTATATRIIYGREIVVQATFKTTQFAQKHRKFLTKTQLIESENITIQETENNQIKHPKKSKFTGVLIWSILIWLGIVIIFKPTSMIVLIGFILAPLFAYTISAFLGEKSNNNQVLTPQKQPSPSNKQNNTPIITSKELKYFSTNEIKYFIEQITSNEEIAKDIIEVTISHPSTFLTNNIVIIDLPGTNSTNETHQRHSAVAKNVIENEADLAIIITPATQLLAESLVNFLTNTISNYLHLCIFMITKVDQIRPRTKTEYNRIYDWAKQRLNNILKSPNSQIYLSAPQIIIDDITGEEPIVNNPQDWITQFTQIQVEIINHLQLSREVSIKNNIVRVFNQLFTQLDQHLQQKWIDYRAKQESLEAEMIPDLTSFTQEQYRECNRMIDRALSQTEIEIYNSIESQNNKTISQIKNAIDNADNWDELKLVINYRVESILTDEQNSLSSTIQNKCNILKQSAQQAGQYFEQKFTEVYNRLQKLGGQVDINSISTSVNININTSSVVNDAQELNRKNLGNAFLGVGARFFKGILNDRKKALWDKINPQIHSYFNTTQQEAKQSLQSQGRQVKQAINQRIDSYIQHYQNIVNQMLTEQETELKKLVSLQQTIQQDLSEINTRRNAMKI